MIFAPLKSSLVRFSLVFLYSFLMTYSALSQGEPAHKTLPDLPSIEGGAQTYWQQVGEAAKSNAKGVVEPYTSLAPVDATEAQKQELQAREAERKVQESYKVDTHQSVDAEEKTLPGQESMIQSAEQAAFQTGVDALKLIDHPFFKYLEVGGSWSSIKNNQEYHVMTLLPLWASPGERSLWFIQPSFYHFVDRPTVNLGFGYRALSAEGEYLWGANTFFDDDLSENNQRISLGVEYKSALFDVSSNYYQRISSWKRSSVYEDRLERPANGWDLRLKQALPWYPQIQFTGAYESWMGEDVDPLGSSDFHHAPKVWEAGISYQPNSLINLSYLHKQVLGGESDDQIQLNFIYQFGSPLHEQFKFNFAPIVPDLKEKLYDKVDRSYRVVLETKLVAPEIKLPSTLEMKEKSKLIVPLEVINEEAIVRYQWDGPAAVFLNDDTLIRPELTAPFFNGNTALNRYLLNVTATTSDGSTLHASTLINVTYDARYGARISLEGGPYSAGDTQEIPIQFKVRMQDGKTIEHCSLIYDYIPVLPKGCLNEEKTATGTIYNQTFVYISALDQRSVSRTEDQNIQYFTVEITDNYGVTTKQKLPVIISPAKAVISTELSNGLYALVDQWIPVKIKFSDNSTDEPTIWKKVEFSVSGGGLNLSRDGKNDNSYNPVCHASGEDITCFSWPWDDIDVQEKGAAIVYVSRDSRGIAKVEARYDGDVTLQQNIEFRDSIASADAIQISNALPDDSNDVYQGEFFIFLVELDAPETTLGSKELQFSVTGDAELYRVQGDLETGTPIKAGKIMSLTKNDFTNGATYIVAKSFSAETISLSATLDGVKISADAQAQFLPLAVSIKPSFNSFKVGETIHVAVELTKQKVDQYTGDVANQYSGDASIRLDNLDFVGTRSGFQFVDGKLDFKVTPKVGAGGKMGTIHASAPELMVDDVAISNSYSGTIHYKIATPDDISLVLTNTHSNYQGQTVELNVNLNNGASLDSGQELKLILPEGNDAQFVINADPNQPGKGKIITLKAADFNGTSTADVYVRDFTQETVVVSGQLDKRSVSSSVDIEFKQVMVKVDFKNLTATSFVSGEETLLQLKLVGTLGNKNTDIKYSGPLELYPSENLKILTAKPFKLTKGQLDLTVKAGKGKTVTLRADAKELINSEIGRFEKPITAGAPSVDEQGLSTFTVTPETTKVGTEASIRVTILDANSNGIAELKDKLSVALSHTSTEAQPVITFAAIDPQNQPGVYQGEFTHITAEDVTVTVALEKRAVKVGESNVVTFTADASTAGIVQNDFTVASGAVANGTASNAVKAIVKDKYDNLVSKAEVTFEVKQGDATFKNGDRTVKVRTDENGEAIVSLVSTVADENNQVTASVNGKETKEETSTFVAAAADATESTFTVTTGYITVGKKVTVTVNVKDGKGNPTDDVEASKLKASLDNYTGTPPVLTFTKVAKVKGQYTVDFTDKTAEVVTVSVTLDSQPVKKGLNNTASFVADTSTAGIVQNDFKVASGAVADGIERNAVRAIVKDANSNTVQGVEVTFTVQGSATFEDGSAKTLTVSTNENGEAIVSLVSTVADENNQVTASVPGKETEAKPSTFIADTGSAGIVQDDFKVASGAVADGIERNAVRAIVKDANSNTVQGVEVTFTVQGSATFEGGSEKTLTVSTNENGEAIVSLVSTVADENNQVTASVNGKETKEETSTFVAAAADATESTFTVTTGYITVGKKVTVTVNVKDGKGNPTDDVEASKLKASLDNYTGTPPVLTFTKVAKVKGQYTVDFTDKTAEVVTVSVTLDSQPVKKGLNNTASFVADTSTAGIVQNDFKVASGAVADGIERNAVRAIVKDANSNTVQGVEVTFTVQGSATFEDGSAKTLTVSTNENGEAIVSLVSTVADENNQVTASVPGKETEAKPSTFIADTGSAGIVQDDFKVASGAVADGIERNAVRAIVKDANSNTVQGVEVTFTVQGSATFEGGSEKTLTVSTNENGEAIVSLVSTVADENNQVTASVNGKETKEETSTFVAAAADATESTFTVTTGYITVGKKVTVTVNVKDGKGNPTDDVEASKLKASLDNYTGTPPVLTFTKVAKVKGQYTVDFTDKTAEVVTVSVTLDSQPVKKGLNNTASFVAGAASADTSTFTVDSGVVEVGQSVNITVMIKDAEGNPTTLTTSELNQLLASSDSKGSASLTAFKLDSGQYRATVTDTLAGMVTVTAQLNGGALQKSGNNIATFIPGPISAEHSNYLVQWERTDETTANGKDLAAIIVTLKDSYDNMVSNADLSGINSTFANTSAKPTPEGWSHIGGGKYKSTFTDTQQEKVTPMVTYKVKTDVRLSAEPANKDSVTFTQPFADTDKSFFKLDAPLATGSNIPAGAKKGEHWLYVNETVKITAYLMDKKGTPIVLNKDGHVRFVLKIWEDGGISGPDEEIYLKATNNKGEYAVSLSKQKAHRYSILGQVGQNGKSIPLMHKHGGYNDYVSFIQKFSLAKVDVQWVNESNPALAYTKNSNNTIKATYTDALGKPIVGASIVLSSNVLGYDPLTYTKIQETNNNGSVTFNDIHSRRPDDFTMILTIGSGENTKISSKEIGFKAVAVNIKNNPSIYNGIPQRFDFIYNGTLDGPVGWAENDEHLKLEDASKGIFIYRNEINTVNESTVAMGVKLLNDHDEVISADSFSAKMLGTTSVSGRYYPGLGGVVIYRHSFAAFSSIRCKPHELVSDYNSFYLFSSSRLTTLAELKSVAVSYPTGWETSQKEFRSSDKDGTLRYKTYFLPEKRESWAWGKTAIGGLCLAAYTP